MPIKEIKKVCFVGAGTMGCYNSLISSLAGYEVTLYDISEQALKNAPQTQLIWAEILTERDIADRKSIETASLRINRTADPEAAALLKPCWGIPEPLLKQQKLRRIF